MFTPLSVVDLEGLEERIKTLSIFSYAEADGLEKEATKYYSSDPETFFHFANESISKYEEALLSVSHPRYLRSYARLLMLMKPPNSEKIAEKMIRKAIAMAPDNPITNWLAADFWTEVKRYSDAEECYIAALTKCPALTDCLEEYYEFVIAHNLPRDNIDKLIKTNPDFQRYEKQHQALLDSQAALGKKKHGSSDQACSIS